MCKELALLEDILDLFNADSLHLQFFLNGEHLGLERPQLLSLLLPFLPLLLAR